MSDVEQAPMGDDAPIQVAELEGAGATAESLLAPQLAEPEPAMTDSLMTKEEFYKMFTGGFAGSAVAMGMAGGPRLRTLAHVGDVDGAREASDALYDSCADLPWMHWLISRSGKWMQRAIMVGMFGFNLSNAIAEELRAQHAEPVKAAASA